MKIDKIVVGELNTNCYILTLNNKVLIIDPGDDGEKIVNKIAGDVVGILITHSHFDHIGAVDYLKNVYKCPVFNKKNLKEGSNEIFDFKFDVVYFPGHYPDLIAFYFKDTNCMFVGDFLFAGSIGRYDFPESNSLDMKNSIKKILEYDNNIIIYPGHYDKTILGYEKDMLNYFYNYIK